MNKKFIYTGLLSTALLIPSVTPQWAIAATTQPEDVAQEHTKDDSDKDNASDKARDDRKTSSQSSDKKETTKQKSSKASEKTTSQQDDSKIDVAFNSTSPLDSQLKSSFSSHKDWFGQLFQSSLNETTDAPSHTYPAPTNDTASAPSQDQPSTPENRDFFEQLQAILSSDEDIENETTSSTDDALSSDQSTSESPSNEQNETLSHQTNTAKKQPSTEDETTSKGNEDISSDQSETEAVNDNDTTEKVPTTDETAEKHETHTSSDKQTETDQNDAMIDALLDEYSEKAEQTHASHQQEKAASEKPSTSKEQKHEAQISDPDTFKSSREQAPTQSYQNEADKKQMRQTTLFETMPHSDTSTNDSETMRVVPQSSTRDFINDIAKDAHDIGQKEDIYASVMIAQAILESDSGKSELSREPYFNLFGIKGSYHGESANFKTLESDGKQLYQIDAAFRKYPDYKASLQDYADLIKGGIDGNPDIYQDVWKSHSSSYHDATSALVGTYATDPQYDQKLDALIETYDLTRFDQRNMPDLLDDEDDIMTQKNDGGAFKPFEISADSPYPYGQCTWYVYNRMAQFGIEISGTMGNAADWTYAALTQGYSVSSKPKVHSAVVFNPNELGADRYYGHVAFVEKVNRDGSIVVSESNVKGLGVISFRTIDAKDAEQLDYITGDLATE
ncbi:glucosaminidase domain-containing protein [Staphylococcus intermedius]|uniref:Mannosyl-glycoprotein endo-beta-N-acetylglucosaminidase n=1 Tax=Staphylococcus intermedius NCTC 11048 TaxID=1141106 RepID=A0A380G5H1_STAIN|nr:glucosaminidase domain-containing protein [Staphylococcus intermedius]PCF63950.1 N-acetylmuramoyl-L-alanine amidase [Staphylococcus intermedius]PCF78665.1 N-acetylmuramoyl-L-alanine amidase [Staphylococcus intermedius]PCF79638.1 N-acetylmuramoyl-L-alanine amidase [Staphylococcus intermedius]PCF86626.1 N-acetylmuramoyl-L-alanine amidase [Staphylococcus intermedius]PCF89703.1 N-acetylmuramoyl-L-alanine amidase [Staphylococcus intermedius]